MNVKEGLTSGRTRQPVKGTATKNKINVNRGIAADEGLTTTVHEGTHALDIAEGIVPSPSEQTPAERLFGEARAFKAEAEFAKLNELTGTRAYNNATKSAKDLLENIRFAYDLNVTSVEFAEILKKVWGG
ncbi:hypothetical protein ACNOYE_35460 [Nannocystaceae bacterium ST9]